LPLFPVSRLYFQVARAREPCILAGFVAH